MKRGRGRPTKYTSETVGKIVKAIGLGSAIIHACHYAGISQETFCQWQRHYPEFSDAVKNAEGKAVVGWLDKIERAASDGNWQAAAWKLERRYPEDFGRRDRVQIDVNALDAEIDGLLAQLVSTGQAALSGSAEGSDSIN